MRRSEINTIIDRAVDFLRRQSFHLPPFAFWSKTEWQAKGPEVREIVENMLGWDITDFGMGDFPKAGLLLFTIRNGNPNNPAYGKTYSEKILIVEEEQVTPMHFHWQKMEDIINRGGGNLVLQLYNATDDERLADSDVTVSTDGVVRNIKAGDCIVLTPGESITLPQRLYHKFWAEAGKGTVLAGEVSAVNDDSTDNRFLDGVPRFPGIQEDGEPQYILCTDYAAVRI